MLEQKLFLLQGKDLNLHKTLFELILLEKEWSKKDGNIFPSITAICRGACLVFLLIATVALALIPLYLSKKSVTLDPGRSFIDFGFCGKLFSHISFHI
jgi:hypothetical protein